MKDIGVIGLGYVGLPLALHFCEASRETLGFDIDEAKIDQIARGESYLSHIAGERIAASGLDATTDFARLGECDAVVICVPTPLGRHREPDLSFIEKTTRMVAASLREGQLVVLQSTTYPGTTAEVVQPMLEESGLRAGRDFFLAFSPEREDPGNKRYASNQIPKVVGADDPRSLERAVALFRGVFEEVHPVGSSRVAETAKLLENIFRSVNIALVNELKMMGDSMGIDVWEVIEAASTKPFGFMPFYPGPGLGGHCIPIDPFYLSWKAREFGIRTRFIELAGDINHRMPEYVVRRLQDALGNRGKGLAGTRVMLLGMAYKPDINDTRESPALEILALLEERRVDVCYHDPYVPRLGPLRRFPDLAMESTGLDEELLAGLDAAVIVTDHSGIDYQRIARLVPVVVDTRHAIRLAPEGATVVRA